MTNVSTVCQSDFSIGDCASCNKSPGLTAEREREGGTNLAHAAPIQVGHPPSETLLRNGYCIVEVHGAGIFHAIFFTEDSLRWHAPNCGRDWRNGYGGQIANGAVACQDYDWAPLVRWSEFVESNISAG